jgi:hypothetical protein
MAIGQFMAGSQRSLRPARTVVVVRFAFHVADLLELDRLLERLRRDDRPAP